MTTKELVRVRTADSSATLRNGNAKGAAEWKGKGRCGMERQRVLWNGNAKGAAEWKCKGCCGMEMQRVLRNGNAKGAAE